MSAVDRYAVIGSPIKHSKSPTIHALFAQQSAQSMEYSAYDVKPENFTSFVHTFFKQGGKGLNCTVPLKEIAWQFATQTTESAKAAKAVNTLVALPEGCILGDNTDGKGLVTDLIANHHLILNNKRILILGAGGATRGILMPLLATSPNQLAVANRTVEKATQLAAEFNHQFDVFSFDALEGQQFDMIINATSASLSDELPPLPDDLLASQGICYDLAYSSEPTAFVKWGHTQGALKSLDGIGMLVEQAAESFFRWRQVRPQTASVIELLNTARSTSKL
jgi:shikimate dehydrogenase